MPINPVKSLPQVKRPVPLVRETACVMLLVGRGIALIVVIKHNDIMHLKLILALNKIYITLYS